MAFLDLPVVDILANPRREWRLATGGSITARSLEVDWNSFTKDTHLFSHCSIVSSVQTEDDGHSIKPACSDLVNNNGNAWTNPISEVTFRSFVGAQNYYEHVQVPELSKGKILDAVLRPVKHKGSSGDTADIYYVDILVATERRHDNLVRRIESNELKTLSMGCLCPQVQCSRCGSVFGDNDPSCEHITSQLRQEYEDKDGVKRIVSELCGRTFIKDGKLVGDPESCKFIEASWVENPAFAGAVLHHFVVNPPSRAANMAGVDDSLFDNSETLFQMRVADTYGMMAIRLARDEYMRQARLATINRVAGDYLMKDSRVDEIAQRPKLTDEQQQERVVGKS